MNEPNANSGLDVFGAPWGRALKVISIGSTIFITGISLTIFLTQRESAGRYIALLLPLLILLPCALFTIREYRLGPEVLLIDRLFWTTRISLAGLESATSVPKAMRGSIRLFGNGGLYSFTGLYRNKQLGMYRAYVTDLNRCVVLRLLNRRVVISPDDPERFIRRVSPPRRT